MIRPPVHGAHVSAPIGIDQHAIPLQTTGPHLAEAGREMPPHRPRQATPRRVPKAPRASLGNGSSARFKSRSSAVSAPTAEPAGAAAPAHMLRESALMAKSAASRCERAVCSCFTSSAAAFCSASSRCSSAASCASRPARVWMSSESRAANHTRSGAAKITVVREHPAGLGGILLVQQQFQGLLATDQVSRPQLLREVRAQLRAASACGRAAGRPRRARWAVVCARSWRRSASRARAPATDTSAAWSCWARRSDSTAS